MIRNPQAISHPWSGAARYAAGMSDRVVFFGSLLAATGIVGGGILVLLDKAAPIVQTTPAPVAAQAPVVIAPQAPTVPSDPAVYRCKVGGSVLYSDAPCKGGTVVDIQPTRGYEAPRRSLRSASVVISEAPAQGAAVTTSTNVSNESACRLLDQEIAAIDAAARVGGTIPYMEDLKERRRKLVSRKYELRC